MAQPTDGWLGQSLRTHEFAFVNPRRLLNAHSIPSSLSRLLREAKMRFLRNVTRPQIAAEICTISKIAGAYTQLRVQTVSLRYFALPSAQSSERITASSERGRSLSLLRIGTASAGPKELYHGIYITVKTVCTTSKMRRSPTRL